MGKRLIYVFSVCITIGLLLALWVTRGFQDFATWKSKPLIPFVWGILVLAVGLGSILFTNRVATTLESRTELETWARGSICGLMVAVVWACLYLADTLLKETLLKYEYYLIAIGLAAALGLGVIGVLSDRFLRENLVAIGWLTAVAGCVVYGNKQPQLGQSVAAVGVSAVLSVTLVTGRFRLYQRGVGTREISREENPGVFWVVVVLQASLVIWLIFSAIRGTLVA